MDHSLDAHLWCSLRSLAWSSNGEQACAAGRLCILRGHLRGRGEGRVGERSRWRKPLVDNDLDGDGQQLLGSEEIISSRLAYKLSS